jgi:hypothetical protein
MSLSKEYQEYHLTTRGWVEGAFKGDALGESKNLRIPDNRVLTLACYEVSFSTNSKTHFYDKIIWESEDKDLIRRLKQKYGKRPNWFGYEMMKR